MMKQQDYLRTMDGLTAPHEAIQRTLDAVRSAEIKEDNISYEENKAKPRYRWITAVAAVLVLAVAFTAVFAVRQSSAPQIAGNSEHSFIIKAGAAEVNPDYYVEIGEMKQDGASWGAEWDEDVDTDGNPFLYYTKMSATIAYTIDNLKCSGEGVDYFTYTVHGGYFIMDGRTGEVLRAISDPDADNGMSLQLIVDDDSSRFTLTDEEYKAFIAFGYSDDTGKYREMMGGDQGVDEDGNRYIQPKYGEVYRELFNENAADRYLLITAHYEDGTTLSKKLVFELIEKESDEEDYFPHYMLTAKIEE